jgi:4-hydroxythreonine-4-phosphate dehydrogenase
MGKSIVITPGEPAGVGPDLLIQLCQERVMSDLLIVASVELLAKRAVELGLPLNCITDESSVTELGQLAVRDLSLNNLPETGVPDSENAGYLLTALDIAIDGCLAEEFSAMVTGPVNKAIISDAGYAFTGHTEYLAERSGTVLPVMLLATDDLRVALATTHLALKDVPGAISKELIENVVRVIDQQFAGRFDIESPRIGVCGLNPHAGEGGYLGSEEIDHIIPALNQLRTEGIKVDGPLPADTAFTEHVLEQYDVILAMYHDQGLPVLKHHGFGRAANITLGLPFVRTSVDHGTAFDIAGSGTADLGGLKTALAYAKALSA